MGVGAWILVAIVVAIALAVATIVVLAMRRPDRFSVTRSLTIPAPPERIIGHIENLRALDEWNPFVTQHPGLEVSYSGPESGPGATSAWQDRRAGTGSLTVTDVDRPREVRMRLRMTRPVKADNAIAFRLEPVGDGTDVSWQMSGESGLAGKVMGLVFNSDRMIGSSFERGLEQLKTIVTEGIANGQANQ